MPDTTLTQIHRQYGHNVVAYASNLGRTQTSASSLFVLPPRSTILGFLVAGTTASNAGTSAIISIGSDGGSGSEFVIGYDVKTLGSRVAYASTGAGYWADNNPINVTGTYSESGTASTAGGPWTIIALVLP